MNKKTITITISVAMAALLVVIVIAGMADGKKSPILTATNTSQTTADTSASNNTSTTTASYKDGTYSATGSYNSPGGEESIKVTITLKDNVITDTSATALSDDFQSREYQDNFVSSYKTLVVGKKITAVHLGAVSGSSLTSIGFNNAIAQIETDAS